MSSEVVSEVHCKQCGESMGVFVEDELIHLMLDGIDNALCFDCDPDSSATTPNIFWQWREGDSFTIGGEIFEVWALPKRAAELVLTRAHDAHARAHLSSYTYLNRIAKNSAILASGEGIGVCVKCAGKGYYDARGDEWTCNVCDGVGTVTTAILLPSWILGVGCENE